MLFFLLTGFSDEGTRIDEVPYVGFVGIGDVDCVCDVDGADWGWGGRSTDQTVADRCD